MHIREVPARLQTCHCGPPPVEQPKAYRDQGGEALALGLRPSAERLMARTGNPLAGQETASLGLDTAALVE